MDRNKKGTTAIDQTTDQDVYSPIKESAKVNWPTMLMFSWACGFPGTR